MFDLVRMLPSCVSLTLGCWVSCLTSFSDSSQQSQHSLHFVLRYLPQSKTCSIDLHSELVNINFPSSPKTKQCQLWLSKSHISSSLWKWAMVNKHQFHTKMSTKQIQTLKSHPTSITNNQNPSKTVTQNKTFTNSYHPHKETHSKTKLIQSQQQQIWITKPQHTFKFQTSTPHCKRQWYNLSLGCRVINDQQYFVILRKKITKIWLKFGICQSNEFNFFRH